MILQKRISLALAASTALATFIVPSATADVVEIEEVVVTAQKKSQRLLDVPVSITAVSGRQLADANIESTGDLAHMSPGLVTVSNGLAFTPAIRGISSSGTSPGDETNVAVYLDDVYMGAPLANMFDLKDIERIEVLKGPQGTLFGRNATGGAVRIVTKSPAFEPEAELSASYGFDFNQIKLGGYVSGGLSDTVAASLNAFYEKDDGYVESVSPLFPGRRFSRTDNHGFRGKLLLMPSEDLTIKLSADYSRKREDALFNLIPRDGRSPYENDPDLTSIPDPLQYGGSVDPIIDVEGWGVAANIDWDASDAVNIKSITSYRSVEALYQTDTDRTHLSIASLRLSQDQYTFSQELVFSGETESPFSWVAGLYYYESDAGAPFFYSFGGDAPNDPTVFEFVSNVDTTAYSAFGELNYDVTPEFHLTAGVRYTSEKKAYTYDNIFGGHSDEATTWKKPTYRVVAQYDIAEDANVYASFSTGFKSGVYNGYAAVPVTGPVEPEELDAFEVGAKARVGGITLTAAAFLYDYTNIQTQGQTFLPDGTWIVTLNNAAKAKIKGFELSASGYLTDELSFSLGVSALPSAKYTEYTTAQVFIPDETTGGASNNVPYDATGSRIIRAPEVQWNAQFTHETDVMGGTLRSSLSYSYNDGFFWQPGNQSPEGSYHILNAKIAWTEPGGVYTFSVWGENLADALYSIYTSSGSIGISDAYAQPRQIGVGVSAKF